jgi:hypothetical protein
MRALNGTLNYLQGFWSSSNRFRSSYSYHVLLYITREYRGRLIVMYAFAPRKLLSHCARPHYFQLSMGLLQIT